MENIKFKTALTIAGSDSSGGAGIQADLKVFQANGVFGMSAVTAVTVQNTMGVKGVQTIAPDIVKDQIDAVFDDIEVNAVKIGMLSNADVIEAVSSALSEKSVLPPVVLDPVMVSKSGFFLIEDDAIKSMVVNLFPYASVITPNIHEASRLCGIDINSIDDMHKAAELLAEKGCKNVLVKGGHLKGDNCIDVLFDSKEFFCCEEKRIDTKNTHGTGCTLSSAIASNLAKGFSMRDSVINAKKYLTEAIRFSTDIGRGCGPVHHFYNYYKWNQ